MVVRSVVPQVWPQEQQHQCHLGLLGMQILGAQDLLHQTLRGWASNCVPAALQLLRWGMVKFENPWGKATASFGLMNVTYKEWIDFGRLAHIQPHLWKYKLDDSKGSAMLRAWAALTPTDMVACGHSKGSHSTEERPNHFSALPSRVQVNVPQTCLPRSKTIYQSARTTCHTLMGNPNLCCLNCFFSQ